MAKKHEIALGIDIGGSGVKGAPVDLVKGQMIGDRHRIDTPQPSTPEAVIEVIDQIADHFADDIDSDAPVGITVPGIVQEGVVKFVGNIDQSWVGFDADTAFEKALGRPVHVLNDADAAGVAEARYGAAKGNEGLVLVMTLGTGIGSGAVFRGELIPNLELGHVLMWGDKAEAKAASSARKNEGLSYEEWATERLQPYFSHIELLFSPEIFVIGGGVSKNADKFFSYLDLKTPIVAAELQNAAGIVGAAAVAADYAAGKRVG